MGLPIFNKEFKMVEITYINQSGFECQAVINNPTAIHHTWYSSKRNIFGKFEKHEVTFLGAFLAKLKDCKIKKMVQK